MSNDKKELEVLKEQADLLGIDYHPSIGAEKLSQKIAQKSASQEKPLSDKEKVVTARQEAGRLIRVNIACMNPSKREWQGEIFTAGNAQIGTFRKFVQFNTEDGYHVPAIILDIIRNRKFQAFKNQKAKNGITQRVGFMVNEFSIEVLPALTEEELAELAKAQAARG